MPLHPRLVLPDVPAHLIQRGHNKHQCFFTDRDFRLGRTSELVVQPGRSVTPGARGWRV